MYLQDVQAAIKSIMNIVNELDTNNQWQNFALCHGLSGIGEILLYTGKTLDNDTYKSLAIQIGRYGIEKYVNHNLPWPCDNRVDEMLGLMIGVAGIGNFYLHLCYPDKILSPLVTEFDTR